MPGISWVLDEHWVVTPQVMSDGSYLAVRFSPDCINRLQQCHWNEASGMLALPGVVVHVFNHSYRQADLCEFKDSLVYIVSSRTAG